MDAEKGKTIMEYAFDVTIRGVVRVDADTEQDAHAKVMELQEVDSGLESCDCRVTEFSVHEAKAFNDSAPSAVVPKIEIDWTRIDNDTCGNPRYVCHFLSLLTPEEKVADHASGHGITERYALACKRANKIGGRKFHTKKYGGGIVFQTYSLDETEAAIARVLAKA